MKPLKQITAKVLLGLLFMSISITASAGIHETAEEEKTTGSFTAGADLVSSYVWRGFTQNAGPNLQPTVSFTYGGLTIGAWGSTNFIGTAKEVDFYLTYATGAFSATITDYNWLFTQSYFNYDPLTTDHVYELSLNFAGVEKFPLSVSVNTMLLGADLNSVGEQGLSSYVELAYPILPNAKLFVGGLLISDGASNAYGFGNEGFNITNIGFKASKEIKFSENFSIPVYGVIGINPGTEDAYLVAGITF
jgi:hypothetical protein